MSLVPDYSSDSETSDTEQVVNAQPQKRTLSSILPPPKEKKSIYVDLPANSLDDNDEDQKPVKRTKTTAGFSIADLLPAPKNNRGGLTGVDKPSAALSLAKKLREKKEEKKQEEVTTAVGEEEEEEEEVEEQPKKYTGPFFHIGKELKEDEPVIKSTPKPIQPTLGLEYTVERPKEPEKTAVDAYEYDPNAMYSADPSAYYYYQQQHQESQSIADDNDDNNELDDLQHLVGHRARGEQKIQIKTVNQADMLPSEEWRAQHALIQAPKFDDGISLTASKLQLKKNNIMALAAHAVSNREKLDNMFAEQRKTKRDAARKYGF